MRDLTSKQKQILIREFKRGCPTIEGRSLFGLSPKIVCFDDLSLSVIEDLERINNTEVLYQNINYFLDELYSKWVDQ